MQHIILLGKNMNQSYKIRKDLTITILLEFLRERIFMYKIKDTIKMVFTDVFFSIPLAKCVLPLTENFPVFQISTFESVFIKFITVRQCMYHSCLLIFLG